MKVTAFDKIQYALRLKLTAGFSYYRPNSANVHEKLTGLDKLSAFPGRVQRHVKNPLWYKDDIKRK